MNENNLATELLHEVKNSAKRWFIIALVELALLLIGGAGFVWYISLPVEDTQVEYIQDMNNISHSSANQSIGETGNGKDEAGSP